MYKLSALIITFIAFVFLSGCGIPEKSITKESLEKYISNPKNGLIQEEEVNGIKVKLSFRPSSLMVAQELLESGKKDSLFIQSLKKRYADNYYFFLNYSKNGKEAIRQLGSFSRYSEMLQVFAFKMNDFVTITTPQKDTVALSDYLFEQTNGMSAGNIMLLVFLKDKLANSDKLEINIAECGLGIGYLKFGFKKSDLKKVPELDYQNIE